MIYSGNKPNRKDLVNLINATLKTYSNSIGKFSEDVYIFFNNLDKYVSTSTKHNNQYDFYRIEGGDIIEQLPTLKLYSKGEQLMDMQEPEDYWHPEGDTLNMQHSKLTKSISDGSLVNEKLNQIKNKVSHLVNF